MDVEIVSADDGGLTLRDRTVAETFHSTRDVIVEARHVFLDAGGALAAGRCRYPAGAQPVDDDVGVRILEIGFGCGVNFVLTAQAMADRHLPLHYTGIDIRRLPAEIVRDVLESHSALAGPWRDRLIAMFSEGDTDAPRLHAGRDTVQLDLLFGDARSAIRGCFAGSGVTNAPRAFDICYLDAFSPGRAPELWSLAFLEDIGRVLKPGGILVSYSAQGAFRRNLDAAGFDVQRLPGPAGKRHMTLGRRRAAPETP